jgi:hypothetical protein
MAALAVCSGLALREPCAVGGDTYILHFSDGNRPLLFLAFMLRSIQETHVLASVLFSGS